MLRFATKNISAINGKQQFHQLIILPVDVDVKPSELENLPGVLDNYEISLEEKYKSSFKRILAIMDLIANSKTVPKEKFKDITPKNELVKEYEFKCGDLRVYAIKKVNGQIVMFGGYKNKQQQEIKRFRSLKKQYLDTIQNRQK